MFILLHALANYSAFVGTFDAFNSDREIKLTGSEAFLCSVKTKQKYMLYWIVKKIIILHKRESPPKNKNPVIYSLVCRSKPVCLSFFCRTQNKIFFSSHFSHHMNNKYNGNKTIWWTTFFKISYFEVSRK